MAVLAFVLFFGSAGAAGAQLLTLLQPPPPQPAAPPPPADAAGGKRITYSISQQRASLYEGERMVRSYAVSGRKGFPRAGTYRVFSKSKVSTAGSLRLDNMVRFVPGKKATGFHAIPVRRDGTPIQGEDELGQYRSHGCVRQAPSDAAFLFDWAEIGVPVIVTA
jgi:lipoprotein-anchoring transpeptidase ErfK/SrfK